MGSRPSVILLAIPLMGLMLYLLLWPVPIDPAAWLAPPAPELAGVYEPNSYLAQVERLELADGRGPEDVAVRKDGRVYVGLEDERIVSVDGRGNQELLANTGGRPLGLDFDREGNLIVADAGRGLLSISPLRKITVLAQEAGSVRIGLADDVDVSEEGIVYFSDASTARATAPLGGPRGRRLTRMVLFIIMFMYLLRVFGRGSGCPTRRRRFFGSCMTSMNGRTYWQVAVQSHA